MPGDQGDQPPWSRTDVGKVLPTPASDLKDIEEGHACGHACSWPLGPEQQAGGASGGAPARQGSATALRQDDSYPTILSTSSYGILSPSAFRPPTGSEPSACSLGAGSHGRRARPPSEHTQGSSKGSPQAAAEAAEPQTPIARLARARTLARQAQSESGVHATPSDGAKTPKSAKSTRSRKQTVSFALPQLVSGRCVWPEHWGVTRAQVKELLRKLRQEPDWRPESSVYDLVSDFLIPWTQGSGRGYALLVNGDAPQEVNLMVSHAWGENAEEFLEALLRSTTDEDVLFVCALSLYQAEDGMGPSIAEQVGTKLSESPFRRVLKHISTRGKEAGWRWRWRTWLQNLPMFCLLASVVAVYLPTLMWGCVPVGNYCVERATSFDIDVAGNHMSSLVAWAYGLGCREGGSWTWRQQGPWFGVFTVSALLCIGCTVCSWAALRHARTYAGRMVVVPNREMDIYSRLWCVYEIWVATCLGVGVEVAHTLAAAGEVASRNAQCGMPEDAERIAEEIEAHGPNAYERIDKAVCVTTLGARCQAAKASLFYGFLIAVFVVAFLRINGYTKGVVAMVGSIMLACVAIVWAVFSTFRRAQGTPTAHAVLLCSCALVALGASLGLLLRQLPGLSRGYYFFFEHLGRCLIVGGLYVAAFLVAACCLRGVPRAAAHLRMNGGLTAVAGASASAFACLTVLEVSTAGAENLIPSAVSNASFACGYLFAPLFLGWSAAVGWGVRIRV